MRRIVVVFSSTITALVLLMAWPTSTNRGGASLASLASGSGAGSGSGSGASTPAPAAAAPPAAAAKSGTTTATKKGKDGTFTGQSADTPYGPVQVKITVTGGKFTDVNAIVLPHGNSYDEQVDQYAVPVLAKEAVAAQSAKVSMVGGATYTSTGYLQSLQSALDQAGL
ncbi:FMN-binding protein [Cellulomonas sp. P24]|uniref:FMN-binding protein n=1 Tax=Cellulomonas sp. P24 TaxID=2885206 RepID=UPI00216ACEAB|nr:FMN-binding protein [Cellulomonas sp. P24]MCR6492450.1 FMN-binding protein [Cellulomonas sp. P24]